MHTKLLKLFLPIVFFANARMLSVPDENQSRIYFSNIDSGKIPTVSSAIYDNSTVRVKVAQPLTKTRHFYSQTDMYQSKINKGINFDTRSFSLGRFALFSKSCNQFTQDDWLNYFQKEYNIDRPLNEWSSVEQRALLNNLAFYEYGEYRCLIAPLSEFGSVMDSLHTQAMSDQRLRSKMQNIWVSKGSQPEDNVNLLNYVCSEAAFYRKCFANKVQREAQKKDMLLQEAKIKQEQEIEQQAQLKQHEYNLEQIALARENAAQLALKSNSELEMRYITNSSTKSVYNIMDLDINKLEKFKGDQLQQQLQSEFVDIANTASDIYFEQRKDNTTKAMVHGIIAAVDAGCTANEKNDITVAAHLSDFCNYTIAFLKQAVIIAGRSASSLISRMPEAFLDKADDLGNIILHPFDTAYNLGVLVNNAAASLIRANIANTLKYDLYGSMLEQGIEPDDEFYHAIQDYQGSCVQMFHDLENKVSNMSQDELLGEIGYQIISLGTDFLVIPKVIGSAGRGLSRGLSAAEKACVGLGEFEQETVRLVGLAGLEGACAVEESINLLKQEGQLGKCGPVSKQVREKIASGAKKATTANAAELSFVNRGVEKGQLLEKNSIKLNQKYKGQTIYRLSEKINESINKSYYYYLDSLHYDHLEVFDNNGIVQFVLNLDGTRNIAKTKQALNQAR